MALRISRIVFSLLIFLVVVCVFVLPYLWMVSSGFKSQTDIFSDVTPISWKTFFPVDATLDNFAILFGQRGIGRALINSLLVSGMQVIGTVVVCCLAAYALTRIKFRGRAVIFALILATFMLPTEAMIVPMYGVVSNLGLQDTLVAVALPWLCSPFGLFLLKGAFEQLPSELDEAARIDGAGHFRIFWSVVLPNVRTEIATLALMIFLFSWNAFLWPLVITQSQDNTLVQVAIAQSSAPEELPNWGVTFGGAAIATVPLIILFIVLQRFFVRGIASTGMK